MGESPGGHGIAPHPGALPLSFQCMNNVLSDTVSFEKGGTVGARCCVALATAELPDGLGSSNKHAQHSVPTPPVCGLPAQARLLQPFVRSCNSGGLCFSALCAAKRTWKPMQSEPPAQSAACYVPDSRQGNPALPATALALQSKQTCAKLHWSVCNRLMCDTLHTLPCCSAALLHCSTY